MGMPKFKKTKWKLEFCTECKSIVGRWSYCKRQHSHRITERENVPFKIPDLQVTGHYSWIRAESKKMKQEFDISPTEVTKVIMGPGIQPGGLIPSQWWIWTKKGASLSLTWLGGDTDDDA